MNRRGWAAARALGGLAVVGVLLARLGTGPFVTGLRVVDAPALAVATLVLAATTLCNAWRWRLVARGLGVGMPLGTAVAASYRAQFLNTTLPGGVLGDVHRAVSHGRAAGDLGRAIRAVAWERVAGQVVQMAVALVVLLVLPSPMPASVVWLAALLVVAVVVGWACLRRPGAAARRLVPGVLVTSVLAVAGYATTFLVAARTAGVTAPLTTLLPLTLVVLVAMAVPVNLAGWGPREGAAAWTFGAAGLGAAQGMTVAVVFGVMVMVACLPGAAVLVTTTWLGGRRPVPVAGPAGAGPAPAEKVGAVHD